MPILSFSCKRDELLSHVKTDTTRVFTEHRWNELNRAMSNDGTLYLWWKPRTMEKAHLFDSKVHGLWPVMFLQGEFGPWPWHAMTETDERGRLRLLAKRKYTPEEASEYVRREGFGTLPEFREVLEDKDGEICGRPFIRVRFWDGERR